MKMCQAEFCGFNAYGNTFIDPSFPPSMARSLAPRTKVARAARAGERATRVGSGAKNGQKLRRTDLRTIAATTDRIAIASLVRGLRSGMGRGTTRSLGHYHNFAANRPETKGGSRGRFVGGSIGGVNGNSDGNMTYVRCHTWQDEFLGQPLCLFNVSL